MKNYKDSDYALNKYSGSIVYRFVDEVIEITLEVYLRENPGKTASDFAELKALSDAMYLEQDREDYRQTWKDTPLSDMGDTTISPAPSPEDYIVERSEKAEIEKRRRTLGKQALDSLTDVQRRRYLLYHRDGLDEPKIAALEGTSQQAVSQSLLLAEKKIKKYLLRT